MSRCFQKSVSLYSYRKKMKAMLFLTVLVVVAAVYGCGGREESAAISPEVDIYQVTPQEVTIKLEFVGQVLGKKDIAIRARVEGYLEEVLFEEGSHVHKGGRLYTIESQPFEEAVAARMSELAEAKTMLAKAGSDLGRIRPLAEQNAVSQSDLDGAVAEFEASEASVEAAEAKLRAAQINLGYTRVRAPISGIIGKTRAKVGDFVGREPNPVILNVISQIDTILVQFFITESQYLTLARLIIKEGRDSLERAAQEERVREPNLELILADGSLYGHKGLADFIDRGVDPTTGAILIQASFPNPDELIRSGQFARVRAQLATVPDAIIVPQRCLMEIQGRYSVYVVDDSNRVAARSVIVGPKYHNFWVIREGLSGGEKVVYEGLQKIRPGVVVRPNMKEVAIVEQDQE
jgi:membrane fusion protein (multidrug efflux system)